MKSAIARKGRETESQRSLRIGQFFRQRRLNAGVSVESAAAALGLESESVLEEYESGAQLIPLEDVFTLTNFLNIPPEEVLEMFNSFLVSKGS